MSRSVENAIEACLEKFSPLDRPSSFRREVKYSFADAQRMSRRVQVGIAASIFAAGFFCLAFPSSIRAADTLIASGSVWKYLDNGSNQGTAWRAPGFNDSGWSAGPAQLGYGDNDEATEVSFGPTETNKYITTYFRRSFSVTDASQYNTLVFRLLRDDGAVAYLNGTEVFRNNMPATAIGYQTLASSSVANESSFVSISLPSTNLLSGNNVFAVEIHQNDNDSTDISFDLELIGKQEAVLLETGSTWKYLDNGSDQDTAWRASGLNDSTWASGPAQLGYGDGGEATVVSFGPTPSDKYITTYFRRAFSVADPSLYRMLTFHLLRDDGAVVYLNEQRSFSQQYAGGSIGYGTLASPASRRLGRVCILFRRACWPPAWSSGVNMFAVEIHQKSPTASGDIGFDLRVERSSAAPLTRGPYLQIGSWSNATVRWRTEVSRNGRSSVMAPMRAR